MNPRRLTRTRRRGATRRNCSLSARSSRVRGSSRIERWLISAKRRDWQEPPVGIASSRRSRSIRPVFSGRAVRTKILSVRSARVLRPREQWRSGCCCHGCWPRSLTSSRAGVVSLKPQHSSTKPPTLARAVHVCEQPVGPERLVSGMDDVFVARIWLEDGAKQTQLTRFDRLKAYPAHETRHSDIMMS